MLLALAACNQLLDLEAPDVVANVADADGDGVADSGDNCPDLVNADQLDSDHDRRGDACDDCPFAPPTRDRDNDRLDDACDSCVLGPQVDDDGDGIMDACDLCPVSPGELQPDDDGDLIGNECDQALGTGNAYELENFRALYNPFTHIDPAWEGAGNWQLDSDGSSLIPSPTGLSTLRLDTNTVEIRTASVTFEVAPTGIVGVALADASLRCELRCTAGQCVLHAEDRGLMSDTPPVTVDRGTVKASLYLVEFTVRGQLSCWLYRPNLLPISLEIPTSNSSSDRTSVFASPGNKVLGADLVR